jgi:uncharacterized repeat protein (TIGR03803 family)
VSENNSVVICTLLALALAVLPVGQSQAATFTSLYSFSGGGDGCGPIAPLLAVGTKLYGTTIGGGVYNAGTIFDIDPLSQGSESLVQTFSGQGNVGSNPKSPLWKIGGMLYGTTTLGGNPYSGGGTADHGTIFAISIRSSLLKTAFSFSGGANGASPLGNLLLINGIFYGVTEEGGVNNLGAIYDFDLKTMTETTLYSFGGGSDGALPQTGLVAYGGVIYGTTMQGGVLQEGTIYSFSPKTNTEKVVYSFANSKVPSGPVGGLIRVGGQLYGATSMPFSSTKGTVYGFDPKTATQSIIYNFSGGADGAFPEAGLIYNEGYLYGTTYEGGGTGCGGFGCGTLFRVAINGYETVLHSFSGASDGQNPFASLIDYDNSLIGTTYIGGGKNCGTVFRFQP